MANEIEQMIERIDNEYAKFREENADLPTHLVLSMEARQAIKLMYDPYGDRPPFIVQRYMDIPIVHKEKVIIV